MLLQCILDLDTHPQNNEPGSFIKLAPSFKEDIKTCLYHYSNELETKGRDKAIVSEVKELYKSATCNGVNVEKLANLWKSSALERFLQRFDLTPNEPGKNANTEGAAKKARDRHYAICMDIDSGTLQSETVTQTLKNAKGLLFLGYTSDDKVRCKVLDLWNTGGR